MKTHSLLSAHALTLGLAALLLPAAHAAEPTAAPAFRRDGRLADAPFDWSELIRFTAPAATFRAVEPPPQAAGQNAYVDPTDPNVSGGIYLGPTYTVPAGGDTYDGLYVGYTGTASATQAADTLTLNNLDLGENTGSSGTYNLNGGTLSVSGYSISTGEYVGYRGTGIFTQATGTTNTVNGDLDLGENTGSNGTYNLNGGTLSARGEYVGYQGTGTFTQRGGSNIIVGGLYLGYFRNSNGTANGTYTLSGGTLSVSSNSIGGSEYVGYYGTGTFTQSGGSNTATGSLYLGNDAGASGTYTLSGGTLSVGSTSYLGYEYVGVSGTGIFTQAAGTTHTITDNLYIGASAGSNGTFTLNGGTLSSARTQVSDSSSTGVFTQNGGTHTTTTLGLTGFRTSSVGTYTLNGGTLKVGQVVAGDGGLSGTSTFNFNGGTLQASAGSTAFFGGLTTANVQAGGALIDSQTYSVTVSQPLLTGTASGTADGGLTKLGTGTLTLTGNNTYSGPTRVNAGTLLVNGTHSGTGAVTVANGGALGGTGALTGAVTVQSGGRLDAGNAGAAGMLTLASNLSLNTGATLGVQLGGTAPGTEYDQIRVAGTLTLGGTLSVTEVNGFNLSLGQTFIILDDTGTSLVTTTFANVPASGLYTDAAGNRFLVNYAAIVDGDLVPNDVTLTVQSVVPEPSTWALLAVGTGALGLALRRRHTAAARA